MLVDNPGIEPRVTDAAPATKSGYTLALHDTPKPDPRMTCVNRAAFEADGVLVLPRLFSSAEMRSIETAYAGLMDRHARKLGPDDRSRRLLVTPLTEADPFFAGLLADDRVMDIADAVLGQDCLYTGLSSAIRWTHATPWHTDPALPGYPNAKLIWYLDPLEVDSGCLNIVPGSHLPALHEQLAHDFESGLRDPSSPDLAGRVSLPTQPGDVLIINRAVWHSTWGPPAPRRQIHITFWGAPGPPLRGAHAWQRMYVAGLAAEQASWRSGARLYSDAFVQSAPPRLRRKLQTLIDSGYCDRQRTPFTATHVEFSQT